MSENVSITNQSKKAILFQQLMRVIFILGITILLGMQKCWHEKWQSYKLTFGQIISINMKKRMESTFISK